MMWPSTPQKRSDTLDTAVSSYKHKQQKLFDNCNTFIVNGFNDNENIQMYKRRDL